MVQSTKAPLDWIQFENLDDEALLMMWQRYDDEALLIMWQHYDASVKEEQFWLGHVEHEIQRRMETRKMRVMPHSELTVKLDLPTPAVDYAALYVLKEMLSPEIIAEGFTPAHEEVVQVPDKWSMIKVNAWGRAYGKDVAVVIEGAKTQGRGRLVIKPKTPGST